MIVSRSNVSGEGPESRKGGLLAPVQLIAHIFRNLVQRHVTRTFVHGLHVLGPVLQSDYGDGGGGTGGGDCHDQKQMCVC